MKNILYIGNKLAKYNLNQTSIETLGPLLEIEGYKVVYASSKKSKILRMLDMIYATLINASKTDYVLIDTYSTYNFWYAFIISQLCRILNLRYIPKLHGGDLPKRLRKNPILCKLIFDNSFVNIAPSGYLLTAFHKYNFTNTIYVPNTIEIQNYRFKCRKIIGPRLLWVRSFSEIYNPEMALKVLYALKDKFSNATLCMVGPDKNGTVSKLKQIATSSQLDVKFTGRLSKEEWTKLSEDYDVFINTTHFDNTPVSVIEAMALGLPIVSTNVGGIPFLLQDQKTAMLVDDNNADQMAKAVSKLITSPTLTDAMIHESRQLAESFDWSQVKVKWTELLK